MGIIVLFSIKNVTLRLAGVRRKRNCPVNHMRTTAAQIDAALQIENFCQTTLACVFMI